MRRLAELIEELCPDGVEYRPLLECVVLPSIPRGLKRSQYESSGSYPIVDQGKEQIAGYTCDETKLVRDVPGIVFGDHTREVKYVDYFFVPGADGVKWIRAVDGIGIRYLFHCLLSLSIPSRGYNRHWNLVHEMRIPVPPLEVQREIVRILDQFTTLEAELEAELEARRTQYEHYRNHLLSYESLAARGPVEMVKLGDVIAISRGASPRPISKFVTQGEGIPWIKIGDVDPRGKFVTSAAERITSAGAEKSRKVLPGDFILSNSMSFGRPYILQIEGCVHDGWLILSNVADHWIPDFLYHSLRTDNVQHQFAQLASGGAVRNLNSRVIESVELALPQKVVQEEIVSLLDRFDALVNDISSGLPAEIAARRAQYEHYRDRLLSFPEKAVPGSDAS